MQKFSICALSLSSIASTVSAADMFAPATGSEIPAPAYVNEMATPVGIGGFAGYVEGSFNKGTTDIFDLDNQSWALRGSANYDAGNGLNIQGDIDYRRTDVEDFDFKQLSGTGHVYLRPTQDYAVGVFGQLSRIGPDLFDNTGVTNLNSDVTDKMAGIEAAWFNEIGTAYGQLGYGQASWTGDDADHLMGRLGYRYFMADNVRIDVEGALHRLSYADLDLDLRTFKAVANYRPDIIPASLFVGYRYDEWEPSVSGISIGKEKNHSILAGLRYHFGSASLKDEERSGPIWSTTSLLP